MSVIQRFNNVQGVYVDGASGMTKKNFKDNNRINLRNTAGQYKRGYIFFPLPAALGTDYDFAKLTLFNSRAIPGSKTVRIRAVTAKWEISKVTWANKPATTATGSVAITKVDTPADSPWEFDIQAILDLASAGQPWYGLEIQIEGSDANYWYWHNHNGTAGLTPYLEASWFVPPTQPSNLTPGNGLAVSLLKPVLSMEFADVTGVTSITGLQVQISNTSSFVSPEFDSGIVSSTAPILDTSDTAWAGITGGQTKWWRAKVRGSDGSWSAWSASTSFTRVAKGTLTLIEPQVAPDNFVTDPTPVIVWDGSTTQRAFQVFLYNLTLGQLVHDSGKITSTEESYTIPGNVIKGLTAEYRVLVRWWDNVDRASTPGDPASVEAFRDFTYEFSNTVTSVNTLAATPDSTGRPWMVLTFKRSSAPDFIHIIRDGELVARNLTAAELLTSPGNYAYTDKQVPNLVNHTWEVVASVNGVSSSGNPTRTGQTKAREAWLCSEDGTYAIPFLNYTQGLALGEESQSYDILNSPEAITVYQSLQGFAGTFSGLLSKAVGGKTADEYLEQLLEIRERGGVKLILNYVNQSFPCVVSKIDYDPVYTKEEIMYQVSFQVIQKRDLSVVAQA